MKNKGDITAAVITYNEADRIGRTLASVKNLASEMVVIDSGSTDETVKIAESFGAKIYI
ncbi:MAG: glycosyltransferase, partial [Mucispirillum sp.]|nr:glycosyltransferase [Mucispirillum sp.]